MLRTNFKRLIHSSSVRLNTLALIESSGGKVSSSTLSTIQAAVNVGKPITALVLGDEISDLNKISQLTNIISVKGAQYEHLLAEEVSPVIQEILAQHDNLTHVFVSASSVGKSILPRLGALLDVQPISDIISVVDENTFVRPIYAGNALATVKTSDPKVLVSVRSSAFEPVVVGDGNVPVEEFTSKIAASGLIELIDQQLIVSERPDLGSSSKVVSGGRGLKDKETFDSLIEPLAAKLHAAVGASRAAVDSGFCDNSLQVGQTGKIVAPDLYLAVGISGAIQHLAGMKDSRVIVAINKDPDAAIFNVADIGLVGDLNEVIPELTSKL